MRFNVTFLYSKTGVKYTEIRTNKWPRPTIQAENSIRKLGVWGDKYQKTEYRYSSLLSWTSGNAHGNSTSVISLFISMQAWARERFLGKKPLVFWPETIRIAFQRLQYPTASTGFILSHITSPFHFTKIMEYLGKKTRGLTGTLLFVAEQYGQDCRCIFFHFTLGTIFYL